MGLALDTAPAVELVDEHVGLVVGPGWEWGGCVCEEPVGIGVVHLYVHRRVFEEVRHPVKDTIASSVVEVGVTFVVDRRNGKRRGGGE